MSELKDVITSYNSLSFSDRIVFYTTISNDIPLADDMQSFLIETRFDGGQSCIYCSGKHVVKNGKRKDGTQRYLCRDCRRSFIPSSDSITSRTRKSVSVWTAYLKCMIDQKTLKKASEECRRMILTENHRIKRNRHRELFKKIDEYCYSAKNLSNSVQYLICQCYRIHQILKNEEIPESWEQEMIDGVNDAISVYNTGRDEKKRLRPVGADNGFIADAYFLSWYLKTHDVYRSMPYATCSQICIQEKCREWKSFYKAKAEYKKNPDKFLGIPRKPGYLDPVKGRGALVITSQNFSVAENGLIAMPGFLKGIKVKAKHRHVRQIRIRTDHNSIRIMLMYEKETENRESGGNIMGIDLGVNNLITAGLSSGGNPVIINGRPLKSINRYYNKRKALLQEMAKKSNRLDITNRMERLTEKRNNKVKDYLHKTSRKIIELAKACGVGHIVIGNNRGWKQKVELGKRTNQTFVSIPYRMLIDMISYKAQLAGIMVSVVKESYTSGTSYLDGEPPEKTSYNIARRIKRGVFKSNAGTLINADVNAAYQIIKAGGYKDFPIRERESITRLNVA